MSSNSPNVASPLAQRDTAYTTPRPDIFEMVPATARRILDVGCSNGALGRSMKDAQPERIVWGIEIDARFALEAANHLDYVINADLNSSEWEEALPDHKFDCIIFADVLEHLVEPQRCLLQAVKKLQPGGSIVVSLPNIRHISALRSIFLSGQFPRRDRGIFDRTHLRWFTIADAHRLLSDCGLIATSTSRALRWGDLGGGSVNRLLNRLPPAVQQLTPIREFLTYQICLRAEAES